MLNFVRSNVAVILSVVAVVVSGCTSLGLSPLPNPYENAETIAEKALVTVKTFGAAQETVLTVCSDVAVDTPEADVCIKLITAEQILRPAVTAAGQIGAEYVDIDARIKSAGTDAPADWLRVAADIAGELAVVYDPIKSDIDEFIVNVQDLTD